MTIQLSERAKQLIPLARIMSFSPWKESYSDELIKIFQDADNESRYLTDEDLANLVKLVPSLSPSLEQAQVLRDNASTLVAKAREQVLVHFPQIMELGGALYPPERAEACWRDFWHFLRCITYGVAGAKPQFTSPDGLKNMQLLYQELRVPLDAMIDGLEQLKLFSLQPFSDEEQTQLTLYFDHLITALKQFRTI
ncbi:MAG: phycobilisome protein [Snowella sp.]